MVDPEDYPITHFDETGGITLKAKDLRWMIERCSLRLPVRQPRNQRRTP